MAENGKKNHAVIDEQRAKMAFLFREDVAPGLRLEMDLNRILFTSESDFQQIDIVETYFGKVSELLWFFMFAILFHVFPDHLSLYIL